MATAIWVALVGGGFSVLVALIQRAERKHTKQHGKTAEAVGRIEYKVDELKEIVVEHVNDPDAHSGD